MKKNLIIACDGEAASGKSTGAKLISKKYKLLLINTGLFYRYATKLIILNKPKKITFFLKKKFKNIKYKNIANQKLFAEEISKNVGYIAKNKKVREIINQNIRNIIKNNKRICLEGRDIASKILNKRRKYDVAFYFKCNLKIASKRRWLELKKIPKLSDVKKSLKKRTLLDKNRTNSPLKKVKDAFLIRTDKLNKSQVLRKMSSIIESKLKFKN